MAMLVREIMNRELYSTSEEESIGEVLKHLLHMGLSSAPVLAADGRPVGMISLRDLASAPADARIAEHMTTPPISIKDSVVIDEAAQILSDTGIHHLVVVDASGRTAGIISSMDVMRALAGLPACHPSIFPHRDHGVRWTDETALEAEQIGCAPQAPGVLVLMHGGRHLHETVLRVEAAQDVRARLGELLERPEAYGLSFWLRRGNLRFMAAAIPDPAQRLRMVDKLLGRNHCGAP